MESIKRWFQFLRTLNLFVNLEEDATSSEQTIRDQIRTTRLYLFILILFASGLILSMGLTPRTISETVSKPSVTTFLRLHSDYPDTLSCPCREIVTSYKRFLSIEFTYHQVRLRSCYLHGGKIKTMFKHILYVQFRNIPADSHWYSSDNRCAFSIDKNVVLSDAKNYLRSAGRFPRSANYHRKSGTTKGLG